MDDQGKRVSWVELYLDLVFVLAVAQLAHLIVTEPAMRSVWIALGLFFTLWWTWVGFAVLYNRFGTGWPASGSASTSPPRGFSSSRRAACRASYGRCCSSRRSSSPGCGPSRARTATCGCSPAGW
jgi:hypothetical protein